jgi:hypothetical protein
MILILLGSILLLAFGFILFGYLYETTEGFQTNQPSDEADVTTFMTTASEYLCPSFTLIQTELSNEMSGTDEEKQAAALQQMVKSAGGPLFPCPPPNEAIAVPADIDTRIQRTATFFTSELSKLKTKVAKALDCPAKEGFVNVCSSDQLKQKEDVLKEAAAKAAAETCVAPTSISSDTKVTLLKTRRDTLSRVMTNPSTLQMLVKVKEDGETVQTLKQDALSGKLTPNCGIN